MNLEFKEQVWKAQFKSTEETAAFEDNIRKAFGLQYRYEAARLLIGRSLAEPNAPDPLPNGIKFYNKPIPGKYSSTEPGKWRETPPTFRPPLLPFWGKVTPFVMTSQSQFRAPPPLPITSKEYADELAYVNKVGPRDGAERVSTPPRLRLVDPSRPWRADAGDAVQDGESPPGSDFDAVDRPAHDLHLPARVGAVSFSPDKVDEARKAAEEIAALLRAQG